MVKFIWHLIRYTLAACISMTASGLLPLLAASIPIFAAATWVLIFALDFALYFLIGNSILCETSIEPFGIILVPLVFGGIGALTVSAVLLLVIVLNVFIVLPASLLTEIIYQRLSIRKAAPRLGGFLLSGLLVGMMMAGIFIFFSLSHLNASVSALLGAGLGILLIHAFSVFVFGFVLTTLSVFKNKTGRFESPLPRFDKLPGR